MTDDRRSTDERSASRRVVRITFDPTVGHEQTGRRPGLVVAGVDYLSLVDTLARVVPLTTVTGGWPNHIPISVDCLSGDSWAMTEQVRTISRDRIHSSIGRVHPSTLAEVRLWLSDFLDLRTSLS